MSPEAQRIAIAEACGWKAYLWGTWSLRDPEGNRYSPSCGTKEAAFLLHTPNYINDLNAIHDAEKWLAEQPNHQYSHNCIYAYDQYLRTHFGPRATAAQRAEAFLRVLGKWEEGA